MKKLVHFQSYNQKKSLRTLNLLELNLVGFQLKMIIYPRLFLNQPQKFFLNQSTKNVLKWVKQRNNDYVKKRKTILKLENEKMEQQIIHPEKELHTIKNKEVKDSTVDTKFDKFGNKVSVIETSKMFMGRKLPRRTIFHCQGILLLHSHHT